MKKNRLLLFTIMNLANYVLVLLACTLYGVGFGTALLFLVLQPVLTAVNYIASEKTWQLIVLSVHLLISTLIANYMSVQLYYQNISSDSGTLLVGKYAIIIGCVYVIILSAITIGIKAARSLSQRKQEPAPVKQPSVMRTLIAVISVILPVLLLGSLVYTAVLGLPAPTFKQVTVSADNAYRNAARNEYASNVAGGQGALYIDAENRLPFGGVYRLDGGDADLNYEADDNIVACYHLTKGMEFDAVIVVWPECELTDEERRRLYTACSRALHAVAFLGDGKLIKDLAIVL